MGVGIFALGVWVLASVPLGLLLGWACGLNKLSPRGGDVRSATPWAVARTRSVRPRDTAFTAGDVDRR